MKDKRTRREICEFWMEGWEPVDPIAQELRALWAVLDAAKGILPRTIALQRALNAYYAGQGGDEE